MVTNATGMTKAIFRSHLVKESEFGLLTDYYELTGGKADFDHNNKKVVTENYFVRTLPRHLGSYMIACGLEQVVHFIENFSLSHEDRVWLKKTSGEDLGEEYLDYLENFKFRGDVYAVPEGTLVFPNEPIINVTGPSADVQLFETYLLNVMDFQTKVATKASRIVRAAGGRSILEFGARRGDGRDAAILGARAAYVAGVTGTSLVLAAKKLGIPYLGTMHHKFVQDRKSELQAFREYAESFPHNTVLLIDTYDTIQGARNACIVGEELREKGYDLKGVRLDSGNLSTLSKNVRHLLDEEGLRGTKIYASGDLDEHLIEQLVSQKAPIDGFGVGSRLITGANYDSSTGLGGVSALGGIYKLVETSEDGKPAPRIKIGDDEAKIILPSKKQVYRRSERGKYSEDKITLWDEKIGGDWKPLLIPILIKGEVVYDFPTLEKIREHCGKELSMLGSGHKRISNAETYPVKISKRLRRISDRLVEEYKPEN